MGGAGAVVADQTPRRGGRWVDHRSVIDGVLWRSRTSCPWRDLPGDYGNWKTVYNRHRHWSAEGTWAKVLDELRRGCDQNPEAGPVVEWSVGVDSTVVDAPISMPLEPRMRRRLTWPWRTSHAPRLTQGAVGRITRNPARVPTVRRWGAFVVA